MTKVSGSTAATLDRFDDYWGGLAQAPGIDARFIADGTARTNALRTGQVDIAEAIPVAQAATLDADTRRETATTRTTSLQLNTKRGVFKDPKLRAAARAAVDTSALAKGVYEGHADAGAGVYGPAVTWAAGKREQPVGRAKAAAPGRRTVTLATYDNRPELPEVAQVLKQQLEQAGFKVELEVREYSRIESDALAGKFDAFVVARNTLVDTGIRLPSSPATTPATAGTTSPCCATRTSTGPSRRPRAPSTPPHGRTRRWRPRPRSWAPTPSCRSCTNGS